MFSVSQHTNCQMNHTFKEGLGTTFQGHYKTGFYQNAQGSSLHYTSLCMRPKTVFQIFKILFQTGDINPLMPSGNKKYESCRFV